VEDRLAADVGDHISHVNPRLLRGKARGQAAHFGLERGKESGDPRPVLVPGDDLELGLDSLPVSKNRDREPFVRAHHDVIEDLFPGLSRRSFDLEDLVAGGEARPSRGRILGDVADHR